MVWSPAGSSMLALSLFEQSIEMVKAGRDFHGRARDLRDGSPFHIEVVGTGFAYGGGPHALAVVRDITEEVEAYHLLEQRVEERTQELSMLLMYPPNSPPPWTCRYCWRCFRSNSSRSWPMTGPAC